MLEHYGFREASSKNRIQVPWFRGSWRAYETNWTFFAFHDVTKDRIDTKTDHRFEGGCGGRLGLCRCILRTSYFWVKLNEKLKELWRWTTNSVFLNLDKASYDSRISLWYRHTAYLSRTKTKCARVCYPSKADIVRGIVGWLGHVIELVLYMEQWRRFKGMEKQRGNKNIVEMRLWEIGSCKYVQNARIIIPKHI